MSISCLPTIALACLAPAAILAPRPLEPAPPTDPVRESLARAEALRGEWSGLVRNESIEPRWIDDAVLQYVLRDESGASIVMRCDARRGEVRPADGRGLPGDLRPSRVTRSEDAGGECVVVVRNALDRPVDLVWLDRAGRRKHYATIAPGRLRVQATFAGHAWLVIDRAEALAGRDAVLFSFLAPATGGQAVVSPASVAAFTVKESPDDAVPPSPRRELPDREPPPSPRSPDGAQEAFLRDGDVWLRTLASGSTRRLTTDAGPAVRYGDSFWWSPDGRFLAAIRTEVAPTREIPIIETSPPGEVQPRLRMLSYPKPGDPIDRSRPVVFEAAKGRAIEVDDALFSDPWSIDRLAWSPERGVLSFLYDQRGHQVLRLIEIDPTTGSVRAAIEETSPAFLDTVHKTFLKRLPGDRAIWMSERSGWNQLYLADLAAGTLAPLTFGPQAGERDRLRRGEWVVRGVERLDELEGGSISIVVRAMGAREGEDPYHVHLARLELAPDGTPSPLVWLTEGDGTHEFEFSPDGAFFVARRSRVDAPPVHEVRRTEDGSLVATLAVANDAALRRAGWRPPERFVAPGRDGVTPIHGVIFLPKDFDPSLAHPVVELIYAGPQDFFVPKSFASWHSPRELAELGFVVVKVDGMGTNWRSKAFHDVCARNLADAGLPDRVAWIRAAAATRPWMDLARVGVFGGSAGGQSAMRALLDHGDFYSVAVADCGCHDNRLDKMWWNEAWMGYPIGPHYEAQSNATDAHRLQGNLMLIVGGEDENVDPASTMRVVDALVAADKDFDLVVLPSDGHGAAESPYGRRRRAAFLHEHLGGPRPIESEATAEAPQESGVVTPDAASE